MKFRISRTTEYRLQPGEQPHPASKKIGGTVEYPNNVWYVIEVSTLEELKTISETCYTGTEYLIIDFKSESGLGADGNIEIYDGYRE